MTLQQRFCRAERQQHTLYAVMREDAAPAEHPIQGPRRAHAQVAGHTLRVIGYTITHTTGAEAEVCLLTWIGPCLFALDAKGIGRLFTRPQHAASWHVTSNVSLIIPVSSARRSS